VGTLNEITERWSLIDLLDANDALDFQDLTIEAERRKENQ